MSATKSTIRYFCSDQPTKALYRRAQASHGLGELSEARLDLVEALKLSPSDRGCRVLLNKVSKRLSGKPSSSFMPLALQYCLRFVCAPVRLTENHSNGLSPHLSLAPAT